MSKWMVTREGPVAVVSLDDGKANALTLEEFESLSRALDDVKKSDAGAVVLIGRDGFFSAGLNLKVLPTLAPEGLMKVLEQFFVVVGEQLTSFGLPVVAAISGHAIAGGAIIAMACDVRIVADGPYKLGLNEVPGGIALPQFAVELMRASVDARHLVKMTMHGVMVNPQQAVDIGFAEEVVPLADLRRRAVERATALAELPAGPYAQTKLAVRGPMIALSKSKLDTEMNALGKALGGRH